MGAAGSADAIIVAAGASTRMDGTDKLLAMVGDRPLLAHTVGALAAAAEVAAIVVVTTAERRASLVAGSWLPPDRATYVEGGTRRQDSVRAGFEALERDAPDTSGERVVLVHDGARPVVAPALVAAVVEATERYGAAIPAVPVSDTLKRVVDGRIETTVDRGPLVAAQTPQGVRRTIFRDALARPAAPDGTWTDEAALLEAAGIAVHVVPGDPANLKVTVPADLDRAALLLGIRPVSGRRSGIGQDVHPFGPGGPLRLGGIEIAGAPALLGHSDGDVALHAVADALLGAAGLGDLGRLYPPGPSTPRGIDSRQLLAGVLRRLSEEGWRPATIDLTITGARPRLSHRLDEMRSAIARLAGLDAAAVNVKASTGNLQGAEGAGRSIAALALATIETTR